MSDGGPGRGIAFGEGLVHAIPPFIPHPLLHDRHVMTIAGAKLPRGLGGFVEDGERMWLPVDDATSVLVEAHWQRDPQAPVLVLVHGLSGSSRSPYMLGTAEKAFRRGFSALRLNIRNCGGTERQTPTLYNAALTDDLHALVSWLGRTRPQAPVCVSGYSLGGALTLHAGARWGEAPPATVVGLSTVSAPIDLVDTSRTMHTGPMNRLYMRLFLDGFVRAMQSKAEVFPEIYPHDAMRGYRDFYEFDSQWTAPAFGYRDANDYYERTSAMHVVGDVRIPTLMLHADDDPLVPLRGRGLDAVHGNPLLLLRSVRYGGHNAFLAARPARGPERDDADRWWAENRIVDWAEARVAAYQMEMRASAERTIGAFESRPKASA